MTMLQTVYRSPNGDDWTLENEGSGETVVVHRANIPSGGAVTHIAIFDLLERNSGSPEAEAVRRALAQAGTN